jgi:starvation-inducible outer membrane lipoprotein
MRTTAFSLAFALAGCAAIPVELVEPARVESYSPPGERIEPVQPREPLRCFERARRFSGVVEVPCDIANEVKG